MRAAIISDLHANLPALTAVLNDMSPVDAIFCCGDVVGYYPDANEVCEEIRRLGIETIRGNHDAYVTGHLAADPVRSSVYRVEWTKETLTTENYRWLDSLGTEKKFDLDGWQLTLRHANFEDEEEYLYPDSPALGEFDLSDDEIVCFGHTHHPMLVSAGKGKIVNPGSVGQPRDWNPDSSYAIIDSADRSVEFRRAAYDVRGVQARLRKMGWDQMAIDILGRRKTEQDEK